MMTIAWDVDDVLNDCMRQWLAAWKSENPECEMAFKDLSRNPPHGILKVAKEEYLASLDKFRASEHYPRMAPCAPVLTWFTEHGHEYRHVAVTAVPLVFAPRTAEWVMRHFGKWIRTFHFVPSARSDGAIPAYDATKADFFRWIRKIDIFIDDNEENMAGISPDGVRGIIFPQPWNASRDIPVERVLAGLEQEH